MLQEKNAAGKYCSGGLTGKPLSLLWTLGGIFLWSLVGLSQNVQAQVQESTQPAGGIVRTAPGLAAAGKSTDRGYIAQTNSQLGGGLAGRIEELLTNAETLVKWSEDPRFYDGEFTPRRSISSFLKALKDSGITFDIFGGRRNEGSIEDIYDLNRFLEEKFPKYLYKRFGHLKLLSTNVNEELENMEKSTSPGSAYDRARLNRAIFEAAFPQQCPQMKSFWTEEKEEQVSDELAKMGREAVPSLLEVVKNRQKLGGNEGNRLAAIALSKIGDPTTAPEAVRFFIPSYTYAVVHSSVSRLR